MRFGAYLEARDESPKEFSDRTGVSLRTVVRLAEDPELGCQTDTALRIVQASREKPAPDGATVTLEDLVSGRYRKGPEGSISSP